MKRRDFLSSASSAATAAFAAPLVGCGGGGDSDPSPAPAPVTPSPAPQSGRAFQFGADVRTGTQLDSITLAYSKLSATSATLPRAVDLRTAGFLPPVGDQGNQPSCVAWAVGYSTATFLAAQKGSVIPSTSSRQASPADLYAKLQQVRPTSCRDGSLITDACDILIRNKISTLQDAPYNDTSCPAPKTNRQFGIQAYRRLNSSDTQSIKAALYDKRVLPIGAKVYSDFVNFGISNARTGIYRITGNLTNSGHAMTVVGYDDDRQAYLVMNSWGQEWGDRGFFWFDYNSFQTAVFEVYSVDGAPQSTVAPNPVTTLQMTSLVASTQINFFYNLDIIFLEFNLNEPAFVNAYSVRYEDAFGLGFSPFQSQALAGGVWATQSYVNFWQTLPGRWMPGRYTLFMDCTRQNGQRTVIASSTLYR